MTKALVGSDDGITVFCNAEKILEKHGQMALVADEDQITLPLKKGRNHLLLKIDRMKPGWKFTFRLEVKMSEIINKNITFSKLIINRYEKDYSNLHFAGIDTGDNPLYCQECKDSDKDRVLTAITEAADYLSNTIIDEKGISKCDYNLTEGIWYPYEPAWHTGQAIYALTDAYHLRQVNHWRAWRPPGRRGTGGRAWRLSTIQN